MSEKRYTKEEINEALFHLGYGVEHRLKIIKKLSDGVKEDG
ncbi:MAG: hypothetical protein ACFFDN_01345 [Candidatus Hodarchaeota archaeon]